MSLNYAIFKLGPKLARKWYSCETSVHSIFFGDSWQQKSGLCFRFWESKVPFFCTWKRPILVILGAKKLDFWCPNLKTETTFCHQLSKKNDGLDTCFTGISFSGEFGANFENSVIFAHFWPSSPYKTPKSKTYGANGQYVSKNSENWYLGSSYIETIGLRRPAHKKGFFIKWDTLSTM